MSIELGLKGRCESLVTPERTATAVGSGLVPVFATPYMVALMENAASDSLIPYLAPGESSVGTHLNISHSSATPVGLKVWAESVVTAVEGRKVTCEVRAYDERGEIGSGVHERFLIQAEKFMAKTQSKLNG